MQLDPIGHLDFPAGAPECDCVGCGRHKPFCGKVAVCVVTVHAINACDQPGLGPDGDLAQLCCHECAASRVKRAQGLERGIRAARKRYHMGIIACRTCGRPIAEMSDFFGVRPIG